MSALSFAFAVVWMGVSLYVGWIGVQQRRIGQRLDALRNQLDGDETAAQSSGKAA